MSSEQKRLERLSSDQSPAFSENKDYGDRKKLSDDYSKSPVEDYIQLSDDIFMDRNAPLQPGSNIYHGYQEHVTGIGSHIRLPVAIKQVAPCTDRHFNAVQQLVNLAPHPNLIRVIQSKVHDTDHVCILYIVTELCSLKNLQDYLDENQKKNTPFDLKKAMSFAKQLVKGMKHIHDSGIVLGSVNTLNILLSEDEKWVKFADFSFAEKLQKEQTRVYVRDERKVEFMPPETFSSDTVSKYGDIFSLGILMFLLFANGDHPFGPAYLRVYNIIEGKLDFSGLVIEGMLREEFVDLASRMLHHDPHQRPTIHEVSQSRFLRHGLGKESVPRGMKKKTAYVDQPEEDKQRQSSKYVGKTVTEEEEIKVEGEILHRLQNIHGSRNMFKAELDEMFIHCQSIAENDETKANYYLKLSETYLSIHEPVKAASAAEEAVKLATPNEDEQGCAVICAQSLFVAMEANIQLFNGPKVLDQLEMVKGIISVLPEENNLRQDFERLQTLLVKSNLLESEDDGLSKVVGASGDTLNLDDCTIYLPKDCLHQALLLNASTHIDSEAITPGIDKIPVTPTLRLHPTTTLSKLATVSLKTWLATGDPASVHVYCKADKEWEELPKQDVKFSGGDRIEFNIMQFCQFCAVQDVEEAAKSSFWLESWLFHEAVLNELSSCIFPRCETYEKKLKERMQGKKSQNVCFSDPTFEVRVNDQITTLISNVTCKKEVYPNLTHSFSITLEFLRKKRHSAENLFLPDSLDGRVTFLHTSKHTRNSEVISEEKHSDGVRTEVPPPSTTTVIAAHSVTTGGQSSVQMSDNAKVDVKAELTERKP